MKRCCVRWLAMSFLDTKLKSEGWRVKIRDKERNETPHASVLNKLLVWRWSLRTGSFLDTEPPPRDVPDDLIVELKAHQDELIRAWDTIYPCNPVRSPEEPNV